MGSSAAHTVEAQNFPSDPEGATSTTFPALATPVDILSNQEDFEVQREDVVSFDDIMDAADRAADAFESSALSRVTDTEARKRRCALVRIRVAMDGNGVFRLMSPESSETEYSLESEVSISVDGPLGEDFYRGHSDRIQGRQELVIIHLSSDSEGDVDID